MQMLAVSTFRDLLTRTPFTMLVFLLFNSGLFMQTDKHSALSALPSGKYWHWWWQVAVSIFMVSLAAEVGTENLKGHSFISSCFF
jgi:hypothetical protein